jgi:hypothetical protein
MKKRWLSNLFPSRPQFRFLFGVVDALDESAAGFYAAHGFVRLPDSLRLVLPMRLAGGRTER